MSQRYIKSFLKYILFKLPLLLISVGFLMVITGAVILIFKTNQPAITQTAWSDSQIADLTIPIDPTTPPEPATPIDSHTSPTPPIPTIMPTVTAAVPTVSPTSTSIEPSQATSGPVATDNLTDKYVVEPGDSWWKIAEQQLGNGYSYRKLAAYNNRSTNTVLPVGITIKMPDKELTTSWLADLPNSTTQLRRDSTTSTETTFIAPSPDSLKYTVQAGDCLWTVAQQHLGSGYKWSAIYALNNASIINPDLIYPGQVITLPNRTDSYSSDSPTRLVQ